MSDSAPNPYLPPRSLPARTVKDALPSGPPTHGRQILMIYLCSAAAIAYVGRTCLGVASQPVQADLDADLIQMSWLMSAFFWSYAAAQVPSGWLAHRLGVRRTLPLMVVVWSLASGAMGLAAGFRTLLAAQLAYGIAQAAVFPCSAAAISQWIPLSRRAVASGLLGSSMSIGGALGVGLTGMIVSAWSWRWAFLVYALPGLLWAAAFYAWFRNQPEVHAGVNRAELEIIRSGRRERQERTAQHWLTALLRPELWMICGQQFFRAAGYVFYTTWFPRYLQETRGVSLVDSALMTSLPLLGVVAGAVLGGLLVDWVWNRTGSRRLSRQGVALVSLVGCALLILLAYLVQQVWLALLLITLGSFAGALAGSAGYTVTIDKGGPYVAPVFGVMNMSGNFGAAICPLVVGQFVVLSGWQGVLLLFVGIYLAAAGCWALLNPEGTLYGPA